MLMTQDHARKTKQLFLADRKRRCRGARVKTAGQVGYQRGQVEFGEDAEDVCVGHGEGEGV